MRFIKIFVLIILLGGCWRLKSKNITRPEEEINLYLKGIKPIPVSLLQKYIDRFGPPERVNKLGETENKFYVVVIWYDDEGHPNLLAWMSYNKNTKKWTLDGISGKGAFRLKNEKKAYPLPPLRKPLRPLPTPHSPDYLRQMIRILRKGRVA